MSVPTVKLNNGLEMPVIGLNTLEVPVYHARQVIIDAIDIGYRYIDCAYIYNNIVEIGKAIQIKIENGTVTRDELFISTKVWNTFHSKNEVIKNCREELKKFNLTYLDMYLMHWSMGFEENTKNILPVKHGKVQFSDIDYLETWEGMEICAEQGLTKSIGVCNFNTEQLYRLLNNCKIMPVANQIECNPHINQKVIRDVCKNFNIVVIAYSPLEKLVRDPLKTIPLINEPLFKMLMSKYRKSVIQIILKYLIQLGTVPIPRIPEYRDKYKLREHIDLFNFILTREDIEKINQLNKNSRSYKFLGAMDHPFYPFK